MAKNDINSREYYVLSISIEILCNFSFFSFLLLRDRNSRYKWAIDNVQ